MFKLNLPGFASQMFSSEDKMDHWSDQNAWDDILRNIRIVVSTHKVLLDALTHAFVKMQDLALIIFDEGIQLSCYSDVRKYANFHIAHHCVSNHPANQIMSQFYMPLLARGDSDRLPKILGLSASPVMSKKARGLDLQYVGHLSLPCTHLTQLGKSREI